MKLTFEPALSPDVAERTKGLRTGFTTGTCAAAAAKAAAIGLVTGVVPASVQVRLPRGTVATFPVERREMAPDATQATAGVVKDAGDDPDCTNGALVTATAIWQDHGRPTSLHSGEGVGVVTKPGLGLPLGAPAINPVPRRMILDSLCEVTKRPIAVTISVPGGVAMAARTSNSRLGIVGGISILGTTGIVRPFSTAAYRSSVVQQIDVAAAQGEHRMVLCTGSRSEQAAKTIYPGLDPVCLVEVGDFTGIALRRCAGNAISSVGIVAMVGKIAKLAAGVMMTHFHRSAVDTALLADVARAAGAQSSVIEAATATATARHFYEACLSAGTTLPLSMLCKLARDKCESHAGGAITCEITMVDLEGEQVVASA